MLFIHLFTPTEYSQTTQRLAYAEDGGNWYDAFGDGETANTIANKAELDDDIANTTSNI